MSAGPAGRAHMLLANMSEHRSFSHQCWCECAPPVSGTACLQLSARYVRPGAAALNTPAVACIALVPSIDAVSMSPTSITRISVGVST